MLAPPKCPQCHAELELGASGKLHAWTCPEGHGAGFTLSEAHERVQEDELASLWRGSEAGSPSPYACPMCERPMASVTIGVDADEVEEGRNGDAPDSTRLTLDVCREDHFIWFDPGELDELPQDLPEPAPTAAELAKIDRITTAYERELDEAYEDDSPLGKFADRVASRHPGFVKFLDRIVYRDAADELDESHAA
jgi:Zn-finger nucleic acid-binding protein